MQTANQNDAKRFLALWDKTYPNVEPQRYHDSWVNFKEGKEYGGRLHSLPESKQYADTPGERREIVFRNLSLIYELGVLSGTGSSELLVLASGNTYMVNRPEPQPAHGKIFPSLAHVKTYLHDPTETDPESVFWNHTYMARTSLQSGHLRQLILAAASAKVWAVTICPPGLEWRYHPYDGGADIRTGNKALANSLLKRHKPWLPYWDPEYSREPGRFTASKTPPSKKHGPLNSGR